MFIMNFIGDVEREKDKSGAKCAFVFSSRRADTGSVHRCLHRECASQASSIIPHGLSPKSFIRRLNRSKISLNVLRLFILTELLFPILAAAESGTLSNPLSVKSLGDFVAAVFRTIATVGLPIIGFFIVWAGFKFLLAQGNEKKLEDAKNNFLWLIAGAILILGAWAISELLAGTFNSLRS